jgi:hypothetical protein
LDNINTHLRGLEIQTGEIQNTINIHVQNTTQWKQQASQWHQKQQHQFADINMLLQQQQKE